VNNAIIAFENKGDGADKYVEWSHALGDQVLVIDAADPLPRRSTSSPSPATTPVI